jgi:uncharacterized protein
MNMGRMQIAALLVVLLAQAASNVPLCGNGADCVALGRKFAAGDGRPVSWTTARELFRRGCERGEGEGCVYQRVFTERGTGQEQLLRASCAKGAADGCSDLGKLLELRNQLPAAQEFYQRGCDLGDAAGCELLGTNILMKRFGPPDAAKADALFAKACSQGEAFGCAYQGLDTATGSGTKADPKLANDLYKRSCDLGGTMGCYYLAFSLANGSAGPVNAGESRRLFRKACEMGYGLSCVALGQAFQPGQGKDDDDAEANRFFKRACNDVTGIACTLLGRSRASGLGGELDAAEAKALYERGCSLGDGNGCAQLGELVPDRALELYRKGCDDLGAGQACEDLAGKVEGDASRSSALLHRACELGKATACTRTGEFDQGCKFGDVSSCLQEIKQLGDTNLAKQSQLMFRACFLKDAEICFQLANAYASGGREQTVQHLKANVLYEMACNLNHAAACAEVANVHLLRQGVAYDPVKAFHLYTQSCDLGDEHGCKLLHEFTDLIGSMQEESCGIDYNGNACNTLGLAYIHGIGQPHDLEKARKAFEKSCDLGDHRGCANFATISTGDFGGRADWAKAHQANEKECAAGDAYSCSELAFFWETGRGVKADRRRAEDYYRKANEIFNRSCQANDADACEALATNQENGRGGPANKVLAKTLREKACGLHACD